jgi:hypothetical protein
VFGQKFDGIEEWDIVPHDPSIMAIKPVCRQISWALHKKAPHA